ncbi:MAG: protein translocase subunit SecD [Nitrospirae bacterium]|nr:protein translocase subunit SecD [Nitrospirota bacterium]
MKKSIIWRLGLIATSIIVALVYLLPATSTYNSMPQWWKNIMPSRGIVLGLDLQGGLHLVFEVEWDKAVDVTIERLGRNLRDSLKKKNITADVKTSGTEIRVIGASDAKAVAALVKDQYPSLESSFTTGSDLLFALQAAEVKTIKANSVDQAIETIRNRIDQFGVAEPTIHRQGANEIVIQLPGVKDPKRAIELINRVALLEFKMLDETSPLAAELPASVQPGEEENLIKNFSPKLAEGTEILFGRQVDRQTQQVTKRVYLVKKESLLTGDLLTDARVSIDTRFNEPYVSIEFNDEGSRLFEDVTGANVKKRMAIVLDKNIHSAPEIREKIAGGKAQISGGFTMEEAKDLAIVLKAGALQAPVKMIQNVTVGPTLGRDSIEAGKLAGIASMILVSLFMAFYYKLSGVIADFALVLNILLLLGALAWLGATLTMPGIAGVILAIGMAVDSNVLMFERMREELLVGKTPRAAVDSGYDKAFLTIVDSHVTTLITAAVLFQYGTGPIKGFAVTLFLGVSINLFTALVGTKVVFDLLNSRKEVKALSI